MKDGVLKCINVDDHLLRSLKEDIPSEDITTQAVMPEPCIGKADLISKQDGILAGIDIFKRVFELLGEVTFETNYKDGDFIYAGTSLASLTADIKVILSGERTALNYLQRMSGIATLTHALASELKGFKTKLLDTRKTTPGMRLFEKYAVKVGGGHNHRFNLSDGILIKDNHINAAGGIRQAVNLAKTYNSFIRKVEVEVENLEMVQEALEAGAEIIMLDNMPLDMVKEAVWLINDRAKIECSGNISKSQLRAIAQIGVDYISCGALTHSAPILDFSLKNLARVHM